MYVRPPRRLAPVVPLGRTGCLCVNFRAGVGQEVSIVWLASFAPLIQLRGWIGSLT